MSLALSMNRLTLAAIVTFLTLATLFTAPQAFAQARAQNGETVLITCLPNEIEEYPAFVQLDVAIRGNREFVLSGTSVYYGARMTDTLPVQKRPTASRFSAEIYESATAMLQISPTQTAKGRAAEFTNQYGKKRRFICQSVRQA